MKTFLIQATAVILAGAGIGSVASPWQGAPPNIPPAAVVQSTPTAIIAPLVFSQVGQVGPGAITVTVNGSPLAGTYTASPIVPLSNQMYVAYLSSGNIQSKVTVLSGIDLNGVKHWYCSAYIFFAMNGSGGGCSGPNPVPSRDGTYLVSSSAPIETGVQGHWYGDGGLGGPPGPVSFDVTP